MGTIINLKGEPLKGEQMLADFFLSKPGALSIRECYVAITGDVHLTGEWRNCDPQRMREAFGEPFMEALTTASWAVALGNAMQRRMQQDFGNLEPLQAWRKVAVVSSRRNFREQTTYRIGGYGNLPVVGEADAYPALASPEEAAESFRLAKRGGMDSVTLEMVANDDTQAILRIPAEFALAAATTLYEFVFDMIRTNPQMADGEALFSSAHGNIGSAALDLGSYFAASTVISKQLRPGSGKRVGFGRKTLLIPLEQQQTADELFLKGRMAEGLMPEVVVVPYWEDANDWAVVNDPTYAATLEVAFLNGREQPEILVQSEQAAESVFTHDKVTYRLRHVYGGTPIGFQGAFKSVVAG